MSDDLSDFSSGAISNAVAGKPPAPAAFDPNKSYGTPAKLLDNLQRTENNTGNPAAVNPTSGAMGNYQFLPSTVAMLKKQGVSFDPNDPAQSRAAADYYISQLTAQNGGDYSKAIAQYGGFKTKDPSGYLAKVLNGVSQSGSANAATDSNPLGDFSSANVNQAVKSASPSQPSIQASVAQIPGTIRPADTTDNQESWVDKFLRGPIEAGIQTATSIPAAVVGSVAGFGYGLTHNYGSDGTPATPGGQATPNGARDADQFAGKVTQALTYQPRGTAGQRYSGAVGETLSPMVALGPMAPQILAEATHTPIGSAVANGNGALVTRAAVNNPVKSAGNAVLSGVQTAVQPIADARSALQSAFEAKKGGIAPTTSTGAQLGSSVGSAGVNTDSLIQTASPEMQAAYAEAKATGQPINPTAVANHVKSDSLDVPVPMTAGQAAENIGQLTNEFNSQMKDPKVAQRFAAQNEALKSNLDVMREKATPDIHSSTSLDDGAGVINGYKNLDQGLNAGIDAKYEALLNKAKEIGVEAPIDAPLLAQNVKNGLLDNLSHEDSLTPDTKMILRQLEANQFGSDKHPMNFNDFKNVRSKIGQEQIANAGTSTGKALGVFRDQLENLPLTGSAAELKPLLVDASDAAKARFDLIKNDPAYAAVVNGKATPDSFINQFVVAKNATKENLQTMRNNLANELEAQQHITSGSLRWLKQQAGVNEKGAGNFSQANYNKAVDSQSGVGSKLNEMVGPDVAQKANNLGDIANLTIGQKRGTNFQNSRSGMMLAEEWAKTFAENAANLKLGGGVLPVGTWSRAGYNAFNKNSFSNSALKPGAGMTMPSQ